jgi:two-component system phosphate regulon response regulator PhoB
MPATKIQKQILIVDRDVAAAEVLRQVLSGANFATRVITEGAAAGEAVANRPPDLVIFEWNMPGFDSVEFIKSVRRARAPRPVRLIILSSLTAEHDVVNALEYGADDYLFKPCSLRELVARVAVMLRNVRDEPASRELVGGHLVLDSATYRVTAHGRLINLRGVEYRLLEFLMAHPERAFNRNQLLVRIWGADSDVDERTVDVNVQRLRKLLSDSGCEAYLQTVRGIGYRFAVPAASRADSSFD